MFGWRWIAGSGHARADVRALELPERDGASHLASVGQSDDIARALERAVRRARVALERAVHQAEHATDELE
jgi:hypothetical protein